MRPRNFFVLAGGWVFATLCQASQGPGAIELRRFDGVATLVRNPGPGVEFYRLDVVARWDRSLPKDRSRYLLRVTLPDGRVETQGLGPDQGPGAPDLSVLVPRDSVRNLVPSAVRVTVQVIDATTNTAASNALLATIEQFPAIRTGVVDHRPFGWGRPMRADAAGVVALPNPGPDGLEFVRVSTGPSGRAVFIAKSEVSNSQMSKRVQDKYDPNEALGENFVLNKPNQPAFKLTPRLAKLYLAAISNEGLTYRMPTKTEWLAAARGGRADGFWWEGDKVPPSSANFLGTEEGVLEGDTTAAVQPPYSEGKFQANPFGLFHVFGNVAEWATTDQADTFARLGGHFRTDPKGAGFLAEVFEMTVKGEDELGQADDSGRLFVGLRPVLELDDASGRAAMIDAFAESKELGEIVVDFDARTAVAKLTGTAPDNRARRLADKKLRALWFIAAVDNQVQTPPAETMKLAILGDVTGPATRKVVLGRWTDFVKVATRWADELPVTGSTWYTNVFLPNGSVISHVLPEFKQGPEGRATIVVPVTDPRGAGVAEGGPVQLALSLGAPATSMSDPRIVSNVQTIRWLPANPVPNERTLKFEE